MWEISVSRIWLTCELNLSLQTPLYYGHLACSQRDTDICRDSHTEYGFYDSDTPPGEYSTKLYTETGYAPRFNCYHLDKKVTPFVNLLRQNYTSKLYGGSQPYQQIYFKVLPKVVFTSKSLLLRVFFSRSYCCYGYEHDTIESLWWPIKI